MWNVSILRLAERTSATAMTTRSVEKGDFHVLNTTFSVANWFQSIWTLWEFLPIRQAARREIPRITLAMLPQGCPVPRRGTTDRCGSTPPPFAVMMKQWRSRPGREPSTENRRRKIGPG
ncbi:hypothetical protein RB6281 [Rhodopirellula baltica SH 1]|uniref:Uncharacterized protein n=1 Tax=Rhodopirellula baltica (strain DSM 10527 / NCIMB 13988 / SH1) TaxID=243090 RepID=Q7UQJ8_RHOBA|nr:hypothetical protein RB6281 [Rhodopirellula baltica SH 1]